MKRRAQPQASQPDAPAGRPAATGAGVRWLDPREPFLAPLLVLLVTRIGLWIRQPFANEDAYITFRYARNFATGQGLTYNPGEPVFGFSSPLWTVWCAVGTMIGDPVGWARLWSLAADVVVLGLVVSLLRRHVSRTSAWCFAFFFAAWPFFAAVTVSGMESSLMLALIVLGAVLATRGSAWGGLVLAALALSRPEGPVAAAIIALWARPRDRMVALALTAAGLVALWTMFGTLAPQSVLAKAGIYGHPGPIRGKHWWDWLVPTLFGGAPVITEGTHLFLLSVIFAPAVVMGAPVVWNARRTALAPIAAAALAIWAGYAALGVAFFFWYLFVPLAGFLLLAACGLPRIIRGPGIPVAAAMLVVGLWTIAVQLYLGRAQNEGFEFGPLSDHLGRYAAPGDTVFLEPIGLIGYRNPIYVLDEVGLVSPEVARRRAAGPGWYADVIRERRPRWLVVRRELLSEGAGFAGRWAPFRDRAERDAVLGNYAVETATQRPDRALVILRRSD